MAEQRTTERFSFEEEITILSPRRIEGRSIDIGAGGIGVEIPETLELETPLEIQILGGNAVVYGTVRWVKPLEKGCRLGIRFREEDWNIIELVFTLRNQEG